MIRPFGNTIAAELVKLRGLPAVLVGVLGTVAASIALAATIAAAAPATADAVQVMTVTPVITFLQIGPVVLGVLVAGSEHVGRQLATTLAATPNRLLLLAGKATAYLSVAAVTSLAAIGAGTTTASIVLGTRGIRQTRAFDPSPLIGAALYLVLIGLLALALTILLRSLIPPLVAMLALVLIVSPLLAGFTEHARWLPDRAGRLLYSPDIDPLLTSGAGTLVLLAWIVVTGVTASAAFVRRDA